MRCPDCGYEINFSLSAGERFHDGVPPLTAAEQERARVAADRRTRQRAKAAAMARFMLENPDADVTLVSPDDEHAESFLRLVREEMDAMGIRKGTP